MLFTPDELALDTQQILLIRQKNGISLKRSIFASVKPGSSAYVSCFPQLSRAGLILGWKIT